ncbi:HHR019Cp [Eremothecium sinecaudum]|uniref:HHR019Cp n=1 Tax=Eremothecium sinecaudum TaxID=45286 RepID=A0A109V0S7_9SACH|nr:HHR019Cp [Eremothecium sinecaudum]AMD22788.1 HHR019Cp [Eremothecium sinecaudum]
MRSLKRLEPTLYTCVSAVITTYSVTLVFVAAVCYYVKTLYRHKQSDLLRLNSSEALNNEVKIHRSNFDGNLAEESYATSNTPFLKRLPHRAKAVYNKNVCESRRKGGYSSTFSDEKESENQKNLNTLDNPYRVAFATEDTSLVPDLSYYYKQYGIEIESFEVVTDDGFILDLWHFVPNENLKKDRSPLLFLHGLLQSSASFATSGRKSLAYELFSSGYDIWLGNNRCGFDAKISPINGTRKGKWCWDIIDLVKYDLKALIETVLQKTGFEKVSLIAHSQGATLGFLGLIYGDQLYEGTDFRLANKVETFASLAPAIYPGPIIFQKLYFKIMSKTIFSPWIFGVKQFVPIMMLCRNIFAGHRLYSIYSYLFCSYLLELDDRLWDRNVRDRHFLFSPSYVSVSLMQWWTSDDPSRGGFRNYAHHLFPDDRTWFEGTVNNGIENPQDSKKPNKYPKLLMFVPLGDTLVNGSRLITHFVTKEPSVRYKIWTIEDYSHLDILWANDVPETIGGPLIDALESAL